ncbi:MAG: ATP-binding protein [Chitinophagales bacterium]
MSKPKNKYIEELEHLLQSHIFEEQEQRAIAKILKKLGQEIVYSDFKVQRTLSDKNIITNVLNKTIQDLEEKSVALELQKKLLEEQSKFKEQLFANVSHELRTPLNGILGMSYLLEETTLEATQKNYVDVIKSSADNLLVIINDLLNLSSINAGQLKINSEPFSTEKFYSDLHGLLNIKAQEKNLHLSFYVSPNVPKYLMGDRTRLYQVLLNLLNNAIKFTHVGSVALSTSIECFSENSVVLRFEIVDTGIGIAPEKKTTIFDSFTQVHSKQDFVYEGTGLGLNIVKKLLDLMEGDIEVNSEINVGTTFTVTIPFQIPSDALIHQFQQQQTRLSIPRSWLSKNIIYIEDNKANLLYAKNMFANWNIQIDTAEDLKEAAEKLMAVKYDCILSDVKLPDGNGLDFIKKLREDISSLNQNTPVIVLTAGANEKGEILSKKLNIIGYIGKPFPPATIIKNLNLVFATNMSRANLNVQQTPLLTIQTPTNPDDYLAHLRKLMNNNGMNMAEMIDIFLNQVPETLKNMEVGIQSADWEQVHFEAHKIKSSIMVVGLNKLQDSILKINKYSQNKENLYQIPALYNSFKKQVLIEVQQLNKAKEDLLDTV